MDSNKNNKGITKEDKEVKSLDYYFLNELIRKELVLETLSNIPVKSIHLKDLSFLSSLIRDNKMLIYNAMYYVSQYKKSKNIIEPLFQDIFQLKKLEEENKVDVQYFIRLQEFLDKVRNIKEQQEQSREESYENDIYINEKVKDLLIDYPYELISDYNRKYDELSENIKAMEAYESSLKIKTKEELEFAPMLVLYSSIESYLEFFQQNNCSLDTLLGIIKFKKLMKDTTDKNNEVESLIPLAVIIAASVYIQRYLKLDQMV